MTKHEFKAVESLVLQNSYAVLAKENDIELNVTIGINSPDYGWFELYDEKTRGNAWYAEGGLEIDGNSITGYDGVFALPVCIVDKLRELGYDVTDVE